MRSVIDKTYCIYFWNQVCPGNASWKACWWRLALLAEWNYLLSKETKQCYCQFSHGITKLQTTKPLNPLKFFFDSWCIRAAEICYSFKFSLQLGSTVRSFSCLVSLDHKECSSDCKYLLYSKSNLTRLQISFVKGVLVKGVKVSDTIHLFIHSFLICHNLYNYVAFFPMQGGNNMGLII